MEQAQPKLQVSFKPPHPHVRNLPSPKYPNTPHSPSHYPIIRKNSNNKSIKKPSVQKNQNQKAFQIQIKYAKQLKQQIKTDPSVFTRSDDTLGKIFNHFEDSQRTIQRDTMFSREQQYRKRQEQKSYQKDMNKVLDSVSGSYHSISKKRNSEKNEDYYVYWKSKAHQYLSSNIKLMEQISSLTRQNQILKQRINQIDDNQTKQKVIRKKIVKEDQTQNIRQISLYYLSKIQQMEKQLKKKEVIIHTLQSKMKELNQLQSGERQRIKLIDSMKIEIEQLKSQRNSLRKQQKSMNTSPKPSEQGPNKKAINNKFKDNYK